MLTLVLLNPVTTPHTQPQMKTKKEITVCYGYLTKYVNLPKGSTIERASNLPFEKEKMYWLKSIPRQVRKSLSKNDFMEFESWHRNYGHLILARELA